MRDLYFKELWESEIGQGLKTFKERRDYLWDLAKVLEEAYFEELYNEYFTPYVGTYAVKTRND